MSTWLPQVVAIFTTIITLLFAANESKKRRAAEARKLNAEASTVETNEKIASANVLSDYADSLRKKNIELSKELDAAHETIRRNEADYRKRQIAYEEKIDAMEREISALTKRVEGLEHLKNLAEALEALKSYPKFNMQQPQ